MKALVRWTATAGVVALLAVAGCSAGSSEGDGDGDGGATLNVGLTAEPASLDFTTNDGAAIPQALLYNVYETLVKVDQSGEIVPALAESWEVSEDNRTYTFHLSPDATFTNGEPFTAADAKFSIEQVQQDWTISLKSAMDIVQQVRATDDHTLEVTLKTPSNDWLYRMTTRIGAMFSRTGVEDLANRPVGTGPYQFSEWNRGDSIVLTRNEDYWGEAPAFEEVALKYFKDTTAENNALLSGTIDVIGTLQSPESLGQFEDNDDYQIIEGTTNGEVVLSMNQAEGPMASKALRQAVKYGIDHQTLLDTCWGGHGTLIGSMVPPTDPWYEDLTDLYPFDQDKAKALVQDAGPAAQETIRLRIPSLPYAVDCGQIVKSQLEEIGLTVTIDRLEFPAAWLTTVFTNSDYDMSIVSHVEPRDMAAVFGDPAYYTHYGKPAFRKLLAQADQGTPEVQTEKMREAARMLAEDAAADWLFLLPNIIVADSDITGLPENAITESFDLTALARSGE